MKTILFCLTLLLVSYCPGLAQTGTDGSILGTVADSSGAVIPGATIAVTNTETGIGKKVVTDANGAEIGRAETGWAADPAAEEFKSLQPNRSLLETIARKTGGEMVGADRLAAFVKGLPSRQAPVMESWSFPLWHTPAVLLFALACFICEWGLRRWKGMA